MSDDWAVVEEALLIRVIVNTSQAKHALAALARLREREAQLQAYYDEHTNVGEISPVQKVVQLQARVARLEEALREISALERAANAAQRIASTALAHEEEA